MQRSDLCLDYQNRLVAVPGRSGAFALIPPPTPLIVSVTGCEPALRRSHEALGALRQLTSQLPNPDLVLRTLDRREAVASSQIEGTNTDVDELFEYEATGDGEGLPADVGVTRNYVTALEEGLQRVRDVGITAFDDKLISGLHARLMQGTPYRAPPGEFKSIQNWIGSGNIYAASLVPCSPDYVPTAMDDLTRWLRQEFESVMDVSVVVRMAIGHAQFEAIHPFPDGNGRVGRLLMPLMLCAENYPPVYLAGYLKSHQRDYYSCLLQAQTRADWAPWVRLVAEATVASCNESILTANRLLAVQRRWSEMTSDFRADASARKLIAHLIGTPVVTVNSVKQALGVTFVAANTGISKLVERGILRASDRRRNRVFVAQDVIDVLRINVIG